MVGALSKTPKMLRFEREHGGRPAEQVIAEAITAHGSTEAAARALNVNRATLDLWVFRLGIQIRKFAEATSDPVQAAS